MKISTGITQERTSLAHNPNFWEGFWRLADPKISLASFASILLGANLAATDGPLHVGWLAAIILGIFAVEVAKNASGDILDFDSGDDQAVEASDRTPFSGGKRVLVDALLTRSQTWRIAASGYLVGISVGIAIVIWRQPAVMLLGAAGIGLAYFYQAPPLRLSYRGLGELAVAIAYGPLISIGTYLTLRGAFSSILVAPSIILGMLIAAFLLINEVPDERADRTAAKRTLVVRLGRARAARVFAALQVLSFLAALAMPFFGYTRALWFGLAAAPLSLFAIRRLLRDFAVTSKIVPAQAAALLTFVLFSLGTSIGFLLI